MKVTSYAVARPAFYDRSSLSGRKASNVVVAPHAVTTRFTYTVPAARKAFVETAFVKYNQVTLPTVTGLVVNSVQNSDGITASTNVSMSVNSSIATLTALTLFTTGNCTVFAGETISDLTYDGSTGGTIQFTSDCRYVEFDA